ncbi:hypothetical protein M2110_004546 [Paenibacillus sp. PastF-4]|nr:hypothetical protein [Paenibacillus sp. PastF-4]
MAIYRGVTLGWDFGIWCLTFGMKKPLNVE